MYSMYNNRPFLYETRRKLVGKKCKLLITKSNLTYKDVFYSDSQEMKNSKELFAVCDLCYSFTWLISERGYVRQNGGAVHWVWYPLPS